MKIVQIVPVFAFGGAEIMCENLTYKLMEKGNEVVVISLYSTHTEISDRMEKNGVKIIYLNKKSGFDISMIKKIKRVLKEEKPDVVHSHLYVTKYSVPACIMARVKVRVHTVHNVAEKESMGLALKLNKLFIKHHKLVPVALSSLIKDTIVKAYKIKADKVPVVFNGINLSNCKIKTDYKIKDKFTILHIGRFSPQKNHLRLIKSFEMFHNNCKDSQLVLIGDGDLRKECEKYVAHHNLGDSVIFMGIKDKVYDYLYSADIFTLPSDYEGVPMTLIEAMGSALPIVATDVGGVPDMIENNVSGLLCGQSESEIVEAFMKLYNDESLRETLGKNALKNSVKFSADEMADNYIKVYKESM